MVPKLDDRDRRILALLQADAWMNYTALAGRVHLSASAVQRRVERMIRHGVILGAHVRTDLDEAPPLTLFLLAELADDAASTIEQFAGALAASPEVAEAHYVTGEADVAVTLRVADMAEYDRFIVRCINRSPFVLRFKTLAALRRLK